MALRHALAALTVAVVAVLAGAAPADADTGAAFGDHVATCAQGGMLSGTHNPGTHDGIVGWDGSSCTP